MTLALWAPCTSVWPTGILPIDDTNIQPFQNQKCIGAFYKCFLVTYTKVLILKSHDFHGNWTHDFTVVWTMLFCLSYRKATHVDDTKIPHLQKSKCVQFLNLFSHLHCNHDVNWISIYWELNSWPCCFQRHTVLFELWECYLCWWDKRSTV